MDMADFRYFAEHNGQTVQLDRIWHDGSVSTKVEHFFGRAPDGTKVQAQRKTQYKAFPSKHECDARCINATGRTMQCECSCGGKNHGKGAFNCAAVS
jgi:hypothetical protein